MKYFIIVHTKWIRRKTEILLSIYLFILNVTTYHSLNGVSIYVTNLFKLLVDIRLL